MEKIKRPKGLVRYASYNNIEQKRPFTFTRRIIAYSVVLVLLLGVLGFSLTGRSALETTILRTPGMLYQNVDEYTVSNLYNLQIVNKTAQTYPIDLKIEGEFGTIKMVGNKQLVLDKEDIIKSVFFVEMPIKQLKKRKTPITISVYSKGEKINTVKTQFLYQ